MNRAEMVGFVENEISKGLNREDAIRLLALYLDHDDPTDPEAWFNQLA